MATWIPALFCRVQVTSAARASRFLHRAGNSPSLSEVSGARMMGVNVREALSAVLADGDAR